MSWILFLLSDLIIIVTTISIIVVFYYKYKFAYWSNRDVPERVPSIPFGNVGPAIMHYESQSEILKKIYAKLKRAGHKFGGMYYFTKPVFVPVDLELIKDILSRSFSHFHDRGFHFDEVNDPLTTNLVVLPGERWKRMRAKLSPAFSSGKMKSMFNILAACSEELRGQIAKIASPEQPINIQDFLERFTADVIATCGFGMDTNCLGNPEAEFLRYCRTVLEPGLTDWIKNTFSHAASGLLKLFKIRVTNDAVLQYFQKIVDDAVEYREKNNVSRKDYMDLLIQLKNKGTIQDDDSSLAEDAKDNIKWTNSEIVAQAFMFFIAGYETSSSTMTFALYELATHEHIQDQIREEIKVVLGKHGGKLTYESLAEMQYLEKVINETLRLHPPIPVLIRQCTHQYRIPNTDVVIEKGINVHIPMLGIQTDAEYFPNPEQFDPERFSEEEKLKRPQLAFLAFGEGPRSCIGTRFGYMQTKLGLVSLLKAFKFKLSPRTELPVKSDPKTLHNHFQQTIWLDTIQL